MNEQQGKNQGNDRRSPVQHRIAEVGMLHREIFTGTANSDQIFVSCTCPMGVDHSYEDGIQYRGPVDASAFR